MHSATGGGTEVGQGLEFTVRAYLENPIGPGPGVTVSWVTEPRLGETAAEVVAHDDHGVEGVVVGDAVVVADLVRGAQVVVVEGRRHRRCLRRQHPEVRVAGGDALGAVRVVVHLVAVQRRVALFKASA